MVEVNQLVKHSKFSPKLLDTTNPGEHCELEILITFPSGISNLFLVKWHWKLGFFILFMLLESIAFIVRIFFNKEFSSEDVIGTDFVFHLERTMRRQVRGSFTQWLSEKTSQEKKAFKKKKCKHTVLMEIWCKLLKLLLVPLLRYLGLFLLLMSWVDIRTMEKSKWSSLYSPLYFEILVLCPSVLPHRMNESH